ncbi:MAG TPA: ABC transporter permease [Patescibacteria group bacterium]|nr:ABC transporter permease [Patescibacteria group bacterium]
MAGSDRFSFRRAFAVMVKEFLQLRRDKSTLHMIVAMPILQLLLFGYALNTDPHHLPAAMLVADHGSFSRSFVAALKNSDYFDVSREAQSEEEAERLLRQGHVQFIVSVPAGFSRDLVRGDHPQILIEADATDPVATAGALGAVNGALQRVIDHELRGSLAALKQDQPPASVVLHRRYNPEGLTKFNIVPGLIAIILTMTGIMMTALAITRERERGTMENLLAMPVRPLEVMMGKIAPYVLIGYLQSFIIVAVAKFLFAVPLVGSLWLLSLALFVFIACNMAWGFTLSASAQNQTEAMQMSMMVTMPSIMLSGFLFPFAGMPLWARIIGDTMPATHFIRISRGVLLKSIDFADMWVDLWPMLAFLVFITLLAMKRYRRTLD